MLEFGEGGKGIRERNDSGVGEIELGQRGGRSDGGRKRCKSTLVSQGQSAQCGEVCQRFREDRQRIRLHSVRYAQIQERYDLLVGGIERSGNNLLSGGFVFKAAC